ncbi:helix-turn-helix domain-containing protein [Paenibacillus polymyxa]|uniref:helix-turn-helix domain-containing protein n=1 Tax=Paenibacillus polymyxa TaxID=1406 RepID=UPI00338DB755
MPNPLVPIKEIAFMKGFDDANNFSTIFKKYEQLTPNQFRKFRLYLRTSTQ